MLKLPLKRPRGFTLIEMMIGVALLAILVTMAVPNFSLWIRNLGIRTAAESLLSGLQLARAEALKENTRMHFQLMSTLGGDCLLSASGPHWVVSRDSAVNKCDVSPMALDEDGNPLEPFIEQTYDGNQANGKRTLISASQNSFSFNGLGRLTSPAANIHISGPDGPGNCASRESADEKERCLRIEVNAGGNIRLCDPALPITDPQGCSS